MRFAWAAAFAALLSVDVVFAQSPDVAKADVLFREGRAAMASGDFQAACPKLEESYRLDPAAGTAVNLGDCFDQQGKIGSALIAYRAARKLLPDSDPRVGPVEKQVVALEKRVPKLIITRAPGVSPETSVTRDGRAVGAGDFGKPLLVNPGEVAIVVSAPGYETVRNKLTLREGQTRKFLAELGDPIGDPPRTSPYGQAAPAAHAARTDGPARDGSTQRTAGYVIGGAGAIGVIGGLVAWKSAADNAREADDACPSSNIPCPQKTRYNDLKDDERGNRTLANVGLGLGGIALAGGVALVLLAPNRSPSAFVQATASHASGSLKIGGVW